jgi:hypothetical protein
MLGGLKALGTAWDVVLYLIGPMPPTHWDLNSGLPSWDSSQNKLEFSLGTLWPDWWWKNVKFEFYIILVFLLLVMKIIQYVSMQTIYGRYND